MKKFTVFFEFYPFQVGARPERSEEVEAGDVNKAIQSIKDKYGDEIEVFEKQTRDSN